MPHHVVMLLECDKLLVHTLQGLGGWTAVFECACATLDASWLVPHNSVRSAAGHAQTGAVIDGASSGGFAVAASVRGEYFPSAFASRRRCRSADSR